MNQIEISVSCITHICWLIFRQTVLILKKFSALLPYTNCIVLRQKYDEGTPGLIFRFPMCIGLNMPVKCPKPEIKVIHDKIGDTIFPLTCRITVSYVSEIALYSFVVTSFEIYSEEACRGQRRHGREESGLGQLYYISSFKRCT